MKLSHALRGIVLGAVLALPAVAATAAAAALRPLSEGEMADVYGRGLSAPTLAAFGALTTQEQRSSYASATAADAFSALGALTVDGAQGLERQLAQQRQQAATTGLQTTIRLAQTMTLAAQILSPTNGLVTLPVMPFPLLFTLPMLPSLPAIDKKH